MATTTSLPLMVCMTPLSGPSARYHGSYDNSDTNKNNFIFFIMLTIII